MLEVQQDAELRPLRAFIFRERVGEPIPGMTTRARLFDALRSNDSQQFGEILADLERRRLSPDSDWIGDDCMVFLLLLGVSRFNVGDAFVDKLLQCRGKTTHPQAQRINHAFEAIRRREFAMEGEFAFIKCVYRTLCESWQPSEGDCVKLYKQLTTPGFVEQLEPFLRLLAIRAFDLVIESRSVALDAGNWNQILQKLQDEGAKLSFSQFVALLKHLRIGVLIAIVAGIVTVFGAGRAWSWWSSKPRLERKVMPPEFLSMRTEVASARDGWTAPFVRYLEGANTASSNVKPITVLAETEPFMKPTYGFTAKGSFPSLSNVTALCFIMRPVNGLTSSIPVDASSSGNTFSAVVPSFEPGDTLRFLVNGLTQQTNVLPTSLKIRTGP